MDDPYQLLYDLAKEEFQGEVERLSRVEGKAFGLLSTLTILIGIYGVALGWLVRRFHVVDGWGDWLIIFFAVVVLASLASSWFYLFRAVTVDKRAFIAVDDALIEFYEENSLVTVNYYMTGQFRNAAEKNRSVTREKVKKLTRGYWAIILSGIFTFALLVSVGVQVKSKKCCKLISSC